MEPDFRAVLRSEECPLGPPGEPVLRHVRMGGSDVLIARIGPGRVVAFGARCPHQDTPLDDATFWDGQLRCPRHNYLYDLDTGRNILPTDEAAPGSLEKLRPGYLPVYQVEESDGWIRVAQAKPPPAAGPPCHAVAKPVVASAAATADGPHEHATETLSVRLGEEFDLVLPTSPQPGHIWRVLAANQGVRVVSERFAPDPPPRHQVRLAAEASGEVAVRCTYGAPWSAAAKEVRSFLVHVNT